MLYTKTQIFEKLESLLEYSEEHFQYAHVNSLSSEINKVKSAINLYLSTDKAKIASQIQELITTYLWFNEAKYQKCENDDELGIEISDISDLYWFQDWSKITTHNCFDFKTIMNISNEDFCDGWLLITKNSAVTAVNSYIGYTDSSVTYSGWIDDIELKRSKELENIKNAIEYMENNFTEISEIIDIFEDRGEVIGLQPQISYTTKNTYQVLVRTTEGDVIETRTGENAEYDASSSSIESLAAMIYLPEYYGLFYIILALELYNTNDFLETSKPVSTFGSGKVYIPSYLKERFKEMI